MDHPQRTGAIISLFIGLLSFFIIGCLFIIPPFSLVMLFLGVGVFGLPALFFIGVPLIFAFLLWIGGQRIAGYLANGYSLANASAKYSSFVAMRLCAGMFLLFIIGLLFSPQRHEYMFKLTCTGITAAFLLLLYRLFTFYTTYTVGLLIVSLTKKKIRRQQEMEDYPDSM